MNLLLDTHIALWAIEDNPRLSETARRLITDPDASITVGVVSLWEIAIKHALGRSGLHAMPMSASVARSFFTRAGFAILPVKSEHVETLEGLQRLHDDPFDRMLVATALCEPLRLVTHDVALAAYSDTVVVV